ncbi:MAG: hypothetical protein M0Z42_02255, partial [Actinomycetota bacterium]|nr:hypothetical protein [Actinomycetota bacterium]
ASGVSHWASRLPGQLAEIAQEHPELSPEGVCAEWQRTHRRLVALPTLLAAFHADRDAIAVDEVPEQGASSTAEADVDGRVDGERLVAAVCARLVADSPRAGRTRARMLQAIWRHAQAGTEWSSANLAAEVGISEQHIRLHWAVVAGAVSQLLTA